MNTLIISTNLNKKSKTYLLAKHTHDLFDKLGFESEVISLSDYSLPMCDGYHCYKDQQVISLNQKIHAAKGIIVCSPVYCYDLNSVAKNLMELTGQSWDKKVVSIICNAGGEKSFMAPLSFMNSLMLDFRCLVLPRYLYVTSNAFNTANELVDASVKERFSQLVLDYTSLLSQYQPV